MTFEGLRRRMQNVVNTSEANTYLDSMRPHYSPFDGPERIWTDEQGREHIEVPGCISEIGERLGLPHQVIVDDV